MLKDKVGIDKNDLSAKLVQWADKLTVDYWGNLFQVLEEMNIETKALNDKLKILYRHISIKEIQQYGRLIDAEQALKGTYEEADQTGND